MFFFLGTLVFVLYVNITVKSLQIVPKWPLVYFQSILWPFFVTLTKNAAEILINLKLKVF